MLRILILLFFSGHLFAAEGEAPELSECDKILSDLRARPPINLDMPTMRRGFQQFWNRVLEEHEIHLALSQVEDSLTNKEPVDETKRILKRAHKLIAERTKNILELADGPYRKEYKKYLEVQRVMLVRADHLESLIQDNEKEEQQKESSEKEGQGSEQNQGQSSEQNQGQSSEQNQGQSSQQNQGQSSQQNQGQSSEQNQGQSSEQNQGQSSQQNQGQSSQQNQGQSSQQNQGQSSQQNQGQSSQHDDGSNKSHTQQEARRYDGRSTKQYEKSLASNSEGGGYGNQHEGEKGFGENLFDAFARKWGKRNYDLTEDPELDEKKRNGLKRAKEESLRSRKNLERLLGNFWKSKRSWNDWSDGPLPSFDSDDVLKIVKSYVENQWVQSLRQYHSMEGLNRSLSNFRNLCRRLDNEYPGTSFLPQYALQASELHDYLVNLRPKYSTISDIAGQVLNLDHKPIEAQANLATLKKVLNELKLSNELSADESLVLHALNMATAPVDNPSDEQMAKAYLRTLVGPLSRAELAQQYPGANADRINYSGLIQAMRGGHLDTYLYMARLSSFLDFFRLKTLVPRFVDRPDGARVPIDNKPFELEPPDDLNAFPNFLLNGPPQFTPHRFLAGDILEMTYREDRQTLGVTKEKDKVVTVLVYDISGSMGGQRAAIEGALMASYADMTQKEAAAGLSEHVIYKIPFAERPGQPERIEGREQSQKFFSWSIRSPEASGSDTVFTSAFIEAMKFIGKESIQNPGLKRANVLFITDGEDSQFSFDRLTEEKKNVPPEIELSLSVVTIDVGNRHMEEAVKNGSALKVFDRFQYRHLNNTETQQIFTREAILKHISQLASDLGSNKDLSMSQLMHLNHTLGRLEINRLSDLNWNHLETERKLKSYVPTEESTELDRIFDILFLHPVNESDSKTGQRIEKLNLLSSLLELMAREKSQTSEQMWNAISKKTHKRIKEWIEK